MSNCQQCKSVKNVKFLTMSNCQQCQIANNIKLSTMSNCHNIECHVLSEGVD